jgi:hypothetical protein
MQQVFCVAIRTSLRPTCPAHIVPAKSVVIIEQILNNAQISSIYCWIV